MRANGRKYRTRPIGTISVCKKKEESRDFVEYAVYKNNTCIFRINIEVTRHPSFLSDSPMAVPRITILVAS